MSSIFHQSRKKKQLQNGINIRPDKEKARFHAEKT